MSKLVQNIINSTKSVIGLKPKAYYAYRSDIQLTIEDNKVTAVTAGILGVIEGCKNFLNAGHEEVIATDNFDAFKQKFNAIINNHSDVVDKLDDIVVFVESNAGVKYVLGAKYGLWKTSQAQMANDNLATIAVEFTSREGMEEAYSEYLLTADISGIPTTENYEDIAGLTIGSGVATPQKVYLEVDSIQSCYVVLPDGSVLSSTAGVINYDWRGSAGRVKLIVPKSTSILRLSGGKFTGALLSNGTYNTDFTYQGTSNGIESISLPNASYIVNVQNDNSLKDVYCPKAIKLFAAGSSLTAKSIGDFLFAAAANNPTASGVANFTGGNNAYIAEVAVYMSGNPDQDATFVEDFISNNLPNWTITLRT
jgi:hypothetical protein